MKCFYHNDLDGRCAAAVVYIWVGLPVLDNRLLDTCEFIEINYNKTFPIDSIKHEERVWIVDFSISPDEMKKLLSITKDVTWIDHHKTAIDKYADFPFAIKGVRKDGEAGCSLTFKYVHWWSARGDEPYDLNKTNQYIPVPDAIKLAEDWDIWKLQYGDKTKAFQAGMGMKNTSPDSELWFDLLAKGNSLEDIIRNGHVALAYRSQWAKDFMKSWSFPVEFEGYKCIAANLGSCNSEYFNSVKDGFDIMMPFVFDGKKWTVSLYSTTIDVSQIAKKYGGGGHKGASGFQCEALPFTSRLLTETSDDNP